MDREAERRICMAVAEAVVMLHRRKRPRCRWRESMLHSAGAERTVAVHLFGWIFQPLLMHRVPTGYARVLDRLVYMLVHRPVDAGTTGKGKMTSATRAGAMPWDSAQRLSRVIHRLFDACPHARTPLRTGLSTGLSTGIRHAGAPTVLPGCRGRQSRSPSVPCPSVPS